MTGTISSDDPRADDVRELLNAHLEFANEHTRIENIHALDIDGLVDPDISFFSYRVDGKLLGVGALKRLDAGHGELKSMHTAAAARGQGVGRAMVEHLIGVARARGFTRVSLETGTTPAFAPAHALYASVGFVACGPFGGYAPSPDNTFMTLALAENADAEKRS